MKKLFFSLTIIISFFLLAEGIARIFYRPLQYKEESKRRYEEQNDDFYARHKTIGWILKPGYNGYPEMLKKIGKEEHYQINSQGLRDKEYSFQKENNVIRIFCSGDSITMGSGSNNDETYPKALERYLNSKVARKNKYEVINGGIGDYNAHQEYLLLRDIGLQYNPDIVILQYYPNDGRVYVPAKKLFLEEGLDALHTRSAFVYFLDRGIRRIMIAIMKKQWEKGRARWQPRYYEYKWLNDKAEVDILIELADKDCGVGWRKVGWQETERQLNNFLMLSKAKGFKLVIVYFPVKFQLMGAGSAKYDLLKPDSDLKKYCLANNIPFISITQFLKDNMDEDTFVDFCHYTAKGAEIVAKFIAKSLIDLKIIKK